MTDYARLVPEIVHIARRAGSEILKHYAGDFAVARKTDDSPVTVADGAAEAIILDALRRLTPEIPTVAEEEVAAGIVTDIAGGRFWLVDPLDGTKEFVKRNGEFTVNIGLIAGDTPALGVIHVPVTGLTYAGAGPGSAFLEDAGGKRTPIACRAAPPEGLTVIASRSHPSPRLDALLAQYQVMEIKRSGSAVKFCILAAGEADLYPRFGRTMEWDTAAGHAIVEAAGGSMTELDGSKFRYGKRGFENPGFIARGRPPG
ncbi:MAG: 3'(2'),5'-bisphosphate nucleotidase CysQ [Proteobacteria bacterium]|nr:3'(2'),5'-bisphosphate nucleotidase CysQ [Pseudomonadota bacterium]MBI3499137.1 3'(2'),5'-bisphosphate nucleotidase CysQ [Pseudomonadota bacterium]